MEEKENTWTEVKSWADGPHRLRSDSLGRLTCAFISLPHSPHSDLEITDLEAGTNHPASGCFKEHMTFTIKKDHASWI